MLQLIDYRSSVNEGNQLNYIDSETNYLDQANLQTESQYIKANQQKEVSLKASQSQGGLFKNIKKQYLKRVGDMFQVKFGNTESKYKLDEDQESRQKAPVSKMHKKQASEIINKEKNDHANPYLSDFQKDQFEVQKNLESCNDFYDDDSGH